MMKRVNREAEKAVFATKETKLGYMVPTNASMSTCGSVTEDVLPDGLEILDGMVCPTHEGDSKKG